MLLCGFEKDIKMAIEEIIDKIKSTNNITELVELLKNIGRIPKNSDISYVENLINHRHDNIRMLAIKVLARTKNINYIDLFFNVYKSDKSTIVKRECVSAIGRLRNIITIDKLLEITNDKDPKIICQAIRGLLVFKGNENVDNRLKELLTHDNEMIQTIIQKEFFSKETKKLSKINHVITPNFLHNIVINGDNMEIMKYLPDDLVHLTFTSPPYYNARDYSIYPSYEAYLNFLEEVFKEVMRITKEGRFLIVNTSPVILPRISRAHSSKRYPIPFDLHNRLTKLGWEFIDDIIWMKPEYSVKNRIGGFQQHRKPLAYKPNSVTEYIMVYRKPTNKLLDWNIHQYSDDIVKISKVYDDFEKTNVWQINPKSDKIHSAVFPVELCKRIIEYYSYVGDLVFDPFGGSGTFGRSAIKMNRYFLLTEIDYEYFKYMQLLFENDCKSDKKTKFLTLEEFKKYYYDNK